MKRHVDVLGAGTFDLLVIGGGVYGAWTAYDAALRGLRVAIVEQDDWASGTSSMSSKLIHGGLRYLEYREFGLVRKALHERNRLRQFLKETHGAKRMPPPPIIRASPANRQPVLVRNSGRTKSLCATIPRKKIAAPAPVNIPAM